MPIIYYCRFLTFCTGSGAQSKILKYDPQTTTQSIYTVKEIASAENCQLKIQTIKNKIENSSFLDKFLRFKNKQIIIQNKYDEFRSRLRRKSKKKSVQCFFFLFSLLIFLLICLAVQKISENLHIVANEPSLAFFRIQEHIRKVLPLIVERRSEVLQLQTELQGKCYDMEYGIG